MRPVLVDTNVLSYLFNGHTLGETYAELLSGYTALISFVTVGEIYRGALRNRWGPRRWQLLEDYLRQFPVLGYDATVCRWFAEVSSTLADQGEFIGENDCWIAACALSVEIPLVTHNRRHFGRIPQLQVLSADDK